MDAHDPRPLICHVVRTLDYGGLENGLVNLINWMPEERFRHAILCLRHATNFRARIRKPDVGLVEIHKAEGKDFGSYARVYRNLRAMAPAIVHTRNLGAIDVSFVAKLAGVRGIVHSEHGLDISEVTGNNHKYNLLRRATRVVVGRYVAVSRDLETWLRDSVRIPADRVSVVYSGVDTERFRAGPRDANLLPAGFAGEGTFRIGGVGRLEAVKDFLALARAFGRMAALRPQLKDRVRLVLIGDGAQRAAIEQALTAAGVRELAWLPGFRDDVPDLFRQLDLFVLPSLREGVSNTALEAMATGLPVVATNVGGNPEVVVPNETGMLVPSGDPEALAHALIRYADNPLLTTLHGNAARTRVERHFSPEAMVRGYTAVYESLVQRR